MPYKDPAKRRAYNSTYSRKAGSTAASKERTRRLALEALGGACRYCGIDDPIVLVIDHKHDDGAIDRKANYAGSLPVRIRRGKANLEDYQVLCHNCNWRKEYLRRKGAE